MPTKPQLFLDLDGVLGDTATHYQNRFGVPLTWTDADFVNLKKDSTFYRDQPLMPDAIRFWYSCLKYHPNPIILTGIPWSIPSARQQKEEWVWGHFGYSARVICCRSVDKFKYGIPGDVLVDDRIKYRQHWLKMGGIFILHTSADDSLSQLDRLYRQVQPAR